MDPNANFGAIHRCGVHVPRLRLAHEVIRAATAWANVPTLKAARGSRAVGNWDEDALTMAVEAARGNSAATTSGLRVRRSRSTRYLASIRTASCRSVSR